MSKKLNVCLKGCFFSLVLPHVMLRSMVDGHCAE